MDLVEFGVWCYERRENPAIKLTMRCLGFTALSLEALLDEVFDVNGEEIQDEGIVS